MRLNNFVMTVFSACVGEGDPFFFFSGSSVCDRRERFGFWGSIGKELLYRMAWIILSSC